ncbi:MAG TPA: phytanoyl-CoA dioxygenase family protein [Polyangiaceae bacterium]|jgi:hypothetical protein
MSIEFDQRKIPGRHRIHYRVLDAHRDFPEREVEVLATREEIEAFVRDGYLVREELIPEAELERLRAAFDQVLAQDDRLEHGGDDFGGTFARHLEDKHPVFFELVEFAPILSVVRAILGPSVAVRGITGRVCGAGQQKLETEWHFHQRVIPDPLPPLFTHPHTVDTLVYLDRVTTENGPLCLLPGSHQQIHAEYQRRDFSDRPNQVVLHPRAGTLVFTHGNLFHRSLPTLPGCSVRRMVIVGFGACWLKPSIYGKKPADGLTARALESADAAQRELLGVAGYN